MVFGYEEGRYITLIALEGILNPLFFPSDSKPVEEGNFVEQSLPLHCLFLVTVMPV